MAQQAGNKGWRKRLKASVRNMARAMNEFFEIRAEAGESAESTQEAMLFRVVDTVGGNYIQRKGFSLDTLVGLTLDEEVLSGLPVDIDAQIGFGAGSDGGGTARIASGFEVFVAVKERGDEWPPFFDVQQRPFRSANEDRIPADEDMAPTQPENPTPEPDAGEAPLPGRTPPSDPNRLGR